MQGSMSAPMEVPRPGQVPPLLSLDMTHAPVAVAPGWPPHLADGNQLLNLDTGTAPGPPLIGSPGSAVSNSPSDSPTDMGSPTRRRGRPRKGEEMTEEERKARRKEINRLAARRAHQKKLDILSKLESANTALKSQLHTTNATIRQYESMLAWCGIDVHKLDLNQF